MISERQIKLLNAIISEYVNTAEPVGSVEVVKKYNFKYSPATARNEMARLFDLGFLEMVHTSSGRVPTAMAYRLFLDQIMQEEEMPVLQEVAMKQRLWPSRFEFDRLLRQAVVSLSENTKELAIGTANDGYVTSTGMVNILDHKETVIGAEIGIENLENCAFIFSSYQIGNKNGFVGIFGPARIKYESVIPAVRYTKNLIEELGESW